jgi:hypothetical protein
MILLLTLRPFYLISFYCLSNGDLNLQRESLMRHQGQQQLANEQNRIASLMSEKQELEEKLNSMSREAAGSAHKTYGYSIVNF